MTDRDTDADAETASEAPPHPNPQPADGEISPCYKAYVERNEHRPDVCTIYSDVTPGDVEETWIRAIGSTFVSRDELR